MSAIVFKRFILLAAGFLICYSAYCQDGKITTEQPDQSYGAEVLEKNSFQLESSLYYNHINDSNDPIITSNLLRYGIGKSVELRLMIEQGNYRDTYIEKTSQSLYPLALGTKVEIVREGRSCPGLALVGYVQLPFTNFDQQHSRWSPALIAAAEKGIGNFTITANIGCKQQAFESGWEYITTTDIKYEVNDHLQLFAEYFGQYQGGEDPVHNADGGILWQASARFQLHLAAGSSLNYSPSYFFINTGFALLLPKRNND